MKEATDERFATSWHAVTGAPPPPRLFGELCAAYAQRHRFFHTLDHVNDCLVELRTAWDAAERPHEVAIAIWFHDGIYDTQRRDNKERSAGWAERALSDASCDHAARARISSLILATRHDSFPPCGDLALASDIDLLPLASPPERFERDCASLRRELEWVPDVEYKARRRDAMRALLARTLYSTVRFREREVAARTNLEREIARL
jgi:predicted metal-dependent HD superfamily phosphohydrolase